LKLSGRALVGLDEFMLRIGHLRVLAHVAAQLGGSRSKTERFAAEFLRDSIQVPAAAHIAEYLGLKRLCPVKGKDDHLSTNERRVNFRYPDITIVDEAGHFRFQGEARSVSLMWQDAQLAHPRVPSRVGAITTEAKSGSKTGLSHIFDWAIGLDLISQSSQAGPLARVFSSGTDSSSALPFSNPYIPGPEILPAAFLSVGADADVFARLVRRLNSSANFPLKKREAAVLFASVVEEIDSESLRANYLTTSQRFKLSSLLRDLKRSARTSRTNLGETSTAWHRTASRLESYVDFGLLKKGVSSEKEKYEYIYYRTERLALVAGQIESATTIEEWIGSSLTYLVSDQQPQSRRYTAAEFTTILKTAVEAIKSPTSVLPLDALTLYTMETALRANRPAPYGDTRAQLEQFARDNEHVARLARGRSGRGAEFLTINIRALQ